MLLAAKCFGLVNNTFNPLAFVSVYALKCYHLEWHQRQTQCRGLLSESVKRIRRLSATRIIILITGMQSL